MFKANSEGRSQFCKYGVDRKEGSWKKIEVNSQASTSEAWKERQMP